MATVLIVRVRLHTDMRNRFLDILAGHAEFSVASEPGCRDFQLLKSSDSPDELVIIETYEDDEALEAHWQSQHMEAFRRRTAGMVAHRERIRCVTMEKRSPAEGGATTQSTKSKSS